MVASATPIGSYSAAEVARLAGVSSRRIGRWAREGIIRASVSEHPNIYSYADAGEAIVAHYLVDEGKSPGRGAESRRKASGTVRSVAAGDGTDGPKRGDASRMGRQAGVLGVGRYPRA